MKKAPVVDLDELDKKLEKDFGIVSKKDFFATATKSSFKKVIEELEIIPNTCFIDFGSGLGHILFYMHELYPDLVTCIVYEYDVDFVEESINRRNLLGYDKVQIYQKDIFEITSDSIGEFDYVICFELESFSFYSTYFACLLFFNSVLFIVQQKNRKENK